MAADDAGTESEARCDEARQTQDSSDAPGRSGRAIP